MGAPFAPTRTAAGTALAGAAVAAAGVAHSGSDSSTLSGGVTGTGAAVAKLDGAGGRSPRHGRGLDLGRVLGALRSHHRCRSIGTAAACGAGSALLRGTGVTTPRVRAAKRLRANRSWLRAGKYNQGSAQQRPLMRAAFVFGLPLAVENEASPATDRPKPWAARAHRS